MIDEMEKINRLALVVEVKEFEGGVREILAALRKIFACAIVSVRARAATLR